MHFIMDLNLKKRRIVILGIGKEGLNLTKFGVMNFARQHTMHFGYNYHEDVHLIPLPIASNRLIE